MRERAQRRGSRRMHKQGGPLQLLLQEAHVGPELLIGQRQPRLPNASGHPVRKRASTNGRSVVLATSMGPWAIGSREML